MCGDFCYQERMGGWSQQEQGLALAVRGGNEHEVGTAAEEAWAGLRGLQGEGRGGRWSGLSGPAVGRALLESAVSKAAGHVWQGPVIRPAWGWQDRW